MHRRQFSKIKFFSILSVTFLIFISGLFLGNYLTGLKLQDVVSLEDDLKINIMSAELQHLIISENPCEILDFSELSAELYKIGTKLEFLEKRYGSDDKIVVSLKEYYSLLEIRHWLLVKKIKTECNQNKTIILYFYSNSECDKCQEQGFILDYLRNKYPNLNIYSFDKDIDNMALNTVKRSFDIQSAPTLIINNEKLDGFQRVEQIESMITIQSMINANKSMEFIMPETTEVEEENKSNTNN